MKPLLFLSFVLALPLGLFCQTTLDSSCNLPRPGDRLAKQQVDYKAPGAAGADLVWDFSDQTPLNDHYELKYRTLNTCSDTLAGIEHRTMYYYHLRGDSLCSLGYENPTTLIRYHRPEALLVFPSIPGSALRTDTLPFLLNRDSIDWYLANDSSSLQVDTWRWYADGYRYPIFESVSGSVCCLGKASPYFATSFYYPPHEQCYALGEDSENRQKREDLSEKEYSAFNDGSEGRDYSDDRVSYSIRIDSQGELRIDYLLNEPAEVLVGLYDLQGRQLCPVRQQQSPVGNYTETFSLSDFPDGEYLLRLVVGGKTYGEKVLKR